MRIFNEEKTNEIFNPDLSAGRLQNDKLFIKHHAAVDYVPAKTHYEIIKTYDNGGQDLLEVIDVEEQRAEDAYDEYEDIQIYVPYTSDELKNIYRMKRIPLLDAFDKWEKAVLRGREIDDPLIMDWYYKLLDIKQIAFDNIPNRIIYYM